jgi:nitrate reductase beta subunit
VLVDSDTCRSWRMCVTGCPYKKVFLNHQTGKAEKCTFCFPRIELGMPTVCAQTCVGRLRYVGLVLYDPDRVLEAASVRDDHELVEAHKRVLLDPHDPSVVAAALAGGISEEWIRAAQRSPVYDLIFKYGLALPLHPEYRTLPMVWYVPPLSPVSEVLRDTGFDGEDAANLFAAVDALRIPIGYLASLFTAGDPEPVRQVLRRLAAMRAFMRDINLGGEPDESIPAAVGMTGEQMYDMYRLLAIAKAEDRYVIPHAHREVTEPLPDGCAVESGNGKVSLGMPTLRAGAR